MDQTEALEQTIANLQDRLARFHEAILRINENMDFDSVLQVVLENARTLTGALYGVMALLDNDGQIQSFFSSGLSDHEAHDLWDLPDGALVFENLSRVSGPMRLADFHTYLAAVGLPGFDPPMPAHSPLSFLSAPGYHQGLRVSDIYLADKEGGNEFTEGDEETLAMFAAQAAMVITNARRYREEQRIRAGLEALIDTSPVAVLVFDARTGEMVSHNREATRIAELLQMPGLSMEQLLSVLQVRRADGREYPASEIPLHLALGSVETVRAEEIVVQAPGGQSVTTLVNATPIRSEDGDTECFVVTVQDMTPLEEQARDRAEFLGMVSHELRTPLVAIRGSATTVLDDASALDPAEMRQFVRIILDQSDRMRSLINDLLDVARIETGVLPVALAPVQVADLVDDARNIFQSGGGRHNLRLDIPPGLPAVMADRRRIVQVLGNLLTNAARHSPETSQITVSAVPEDFQVAIAVTDEGRGVPADRMPHLFRKFSRGDGSEQEDTGLGLAICKGIVEAHGGRIWAESDGQDLGAQFTFTIPVTGELSAPGSGGSGLVPETPSEAGPETVRVLAVDDDPQTLRYVRDALTKAGYVVIVSADPGEVRQLMNTHRPQLVVLDLMLPGVDGIDLMRDILESYDVPVIFLSAYGREEVIAKAFDMGAIDYVVKPFAPTELTARIRAALRQRPRSHPPEPYALGQLIVDYDEGRATVAGRRVQLTATEFRLLVELCQNSGRVMTHSQLLERVWGPDVMMDVRPVRTVVKNLRRKLGDNVGNPKYIFTEPRIGYRMPKPRPVNEDQISS